MLEKSQVQNSIKILSQTVEKSIGVSDFKMNSTAETVDVPEGDGSSKKPNGWVNVEISMRVKLGN
jgi:hypothetical protein